MVNLHLNIYYHYELIGCLTKRKLIVVLFLVVIWQLSLGKYILVANAQTNNSASILLPSNMNRMEITLKNDESANPGSIFDSPLLVGLVTAGSAIFGAFMGSYMTNRIEKQRQKELREEREKQKEKE